MGYMRHHAIIVSSWDEKLIAKARREAHRICGRLVSRVIPAAMNGGGSFFVAPDGSKEGWDTSEACDDKRDRLIAWLDSQRYEDGSTALKWVEVQFADDNLETKVTRDSDHSPGAIGEAYEEAQSTHPIPTGRQDMEVR